MDEAQCLGMQSQTVDDIAVASVATVAAYRTVHIGHVDPYLVFTAGVKLHLKHRIGIG